MFILEGSTFVSYDFWGLVTRVIKVRGNNHVEFLVLSDKFG